MKKIDWEKPIQTTDGRQAKLLDLVLSGAWVAVNLPNGGWITYQVSALGGVNRGGAPFTDIINVPEEVRLVRRVRLGEGSLGDRWVDIAWPEQSQGTLATFVFVDGKLDRVEVEKEER